MLAQLKLQVKQAPRCSSTENFTGMLGGVFLTAAELHVHTALYSLGPLCAAVELKQAGTAAAEASVNGQPVPASTLTAVLAGSKDAAGACLTLAELHIMRGLTK